MFGIKLSIIVILITLDWSGNNGNGCFGRTLTNEQTAEVLREIDEEFDCNQLRGEFDHNDTGMLTICESIVNSDLIRKTKEYMRHLARLGNDESAVKPFTKMEKRLSRKKRAFGTECPTFTKEYLIENKDDVGRRSLSPYVSELDYDPKRFPRVLLDSKCTCKGCIDPVTGRQTFALSSMPVEVEHSVLYRNTIDNTFSPRQQKFTVACTCVANSIMFIEPL